MACLKLDGEQPSAAEPLTWELLVRLEPRLADLVEEAKAAWSRYAKDRHFCANEYWFGYPRHKYPGLKPRLVHLVGWFARGADPRLHSPRAYDLAYHTIYDALPPCRICGCMRPPWR